MQEKFKQSPQAMQLVPIGRITRQNGHTRLEIDAAYRAGLEKLDQFSHVQVVWWANQHDNEKSRARVQTSLPYAEGVQAGVFACRSEYRPNPLALTPCPILDIDMDSGIINIADIDAENDTPILDLKPYIPVCDRVQNVKSASWFRGWPEWVPESGLGLQN